VTFDGGLWQQLWSVQVFIIFASYEFHTKGCSLWEITKWNRIRRWQCGRTLSYASQRLQSGSTNNWIPGVCISSIKNGSQCYPWAVHFSLYQNMLPLNEIRMSPRDMQRFIMMLHIIIKRLCKVSWLTAVYWNIFRFLCS